MRKKRILSEEHRQRISKGLRNAKNHRVHNEGHTKETRHKISRTRVQRGIAKGEKNFFYENPFAGSRNGNWNGGRAIASSGYIKVLVGIRQYKYEHAIIAEKALGRPLKRGEVVHHINGNKLDNRNSNLLICSKAYHHMLHTRMAQLYAQEHFG